MSAAEIADNRWETESSKSPLKNAGSVFQLALMALFGTFFTYIIAMSLYALFAPKQESLADQYKNMEKPGGEAPAAAAPAE